jgi:hypothetical protein
LESLVCFWVLDTLREFVLGNEVLAQANRQPGPSDGSRSFWVAGEAAVVAP